MQRGLLRDCGEEGCARAVGRHAGVALADGQARTLDRLTSSLLTIWAPDSCSGRHASMPATKLMAKWGARISGKHRLFVLYIVTRDTKLENTLQLRTHVI